MSNVLDYSKKFPARSSHHKEPLPFLHKRGKEKIKVNKDRVENKERVKTSFNIGGQENGAF